MQLECSVRLLESGICCVRRDAVNQDAVVSLRASDSLSLSLSVSLSLSLSAWPALTHKYTFSLVTRRHGAQLFLLPGGAVVHATGKALNLVDPSHSCLGCG